MTLRELAKTTFENGVTADEWDASYHPYSLSGNAWDINGLGSTYARAIICLHRREFPKSREWRVNQILKSLKEKYEVAP
jgi:hypothetical protein